MMGLLGQISADSIVAALALMVSGLTGLLTLWVNARRDRAAAGLAKRAGAVEGYSKLCEALQEQIDRNDKQLQLLREELETMRQEYAEDRANWARERAGLEERIQELERENGELRRRLDALRTPEGCG